MEQLSLWDQPEENPAEWTVYSRDLQEHDAQRRAWLREWAQTRDWPASWFTLYGKYSGYYQSGVVPGEDGWTGFLEKAVYYDIYCMFIAAFTPGVPLETYLKDAQKRGEIKLDGMMLLWRPGDRW